MSLAVTVIAAAGAALLFSSGFLFGVRRGGTRPASRIRRAARWRWPAYGASSSSMAASSVVRSPVRA